MNKEKIENGIERIVIPLCKNPDCQRSWDKDGPCALMVINPDVTLQNIKDNPQAVERATENCPLIGPIEELHSKGGKIRNESR